jgi:hypothetical protein
MRVGEQVTFLIGVIVTPMNILYIVLFSIVKGRERRLAVCKILFLRLFASENG